MMGTDWDAEPEGELLQRRWFAALMATRRLEAECRQLLEAARLADQAWRRACTELAELEVLAETLEAQCNCQVETPQRPAGSIALPAVFAA